MLQTFNAARTYHESAPNTVVVTLLDEIGLAELSPHLPLKVNCGRVAALGGGVG